MIFKSYQTVTVGDPEVTTVLVGLRTWIVITAVLPTVNVVVEGVLNANRFPATEKNDLPPGTKRNQRRTEMRRCRRSGDAGQEMQKVGKKQEKNRN